MEQSSALRGWSRAALAARSLEVEQRLRRITPNPPAPADRRKQGCYGNTDAVILGRHSGRELRAIADLLEVNDYRYDKRAMCLPAHKALEAYRGYKKLFGERMHASNYPSKVLNEGFLSLAGELRNRLYNSTFILDDPIEFVPHVSHDTRMAPIRAVGYCEQRSKKLLRLLHLLRVNRQFSREASDVFYGGNEFRFTGPRGVYFLRGFMRTIGSANFASLRKITVHIHWPGQNTDRNSAYGEWKLHYLGKELYRRGLQPNEATPPTRAFSDSMRMLTGTGKLRELNLILPFAFSVSYPASLTDLGLDPAKVGPGGQVKVKLIHLRKDCVDEEMHPSQKPLRRISRLISGTERVEAQWADPEAFAEAHGWEYEERFYDRKGRYPVPDPNQRR